MSTVRIVAVLALAVLAGAIGGLTTAYATGVIR
jgi:hypothetical protein